MSKEKKNSKKKQDIQKETLIALQKIVATNKLTHRHLRSIAGNLNLMEKSLDQMKDYV